MYSDMMPTIVIHGAVTLAVLYFILSEVARWKITARFDGPRLECEGSTVVGNAKGRCLRAPALCIAHCPGNLRRHRVPVPERFPLPLPSCFWSTGPEVSPDRRFTVRRPGHGPSPRVVSRWMDSGGYISGRLIEG